MARGLKNRFTFDPANELATIWSPDGKKVVFNSSRTGGPDLYQKAADGSGTEEVLLKDTFSKNSRELVRGRRGFIHYASLRAREHLICLVLPPLGTATLFLVP